MKAVQSSCAPWPTMNARSPNALSRLRSALALFLLPLLIGSCALLYPDVPWQRIEMPLDVTKTGNPVAWSVVLTGKHRYRLFIDFEADSLFVNDLIEFRRLFGEQYRWKDHPGIPLDLKITESSGGVCNSSAQPSGRENSTVYHTFANQNNEVVSSIPGRNVARVLDSSYLFYSEARDHLPLCLVIEITRAAPELAKFKPHLVLEEFSKGKH